MMRSAPDADLRDVNNELLASTIADRVADALERWHDDEGHHGALAHCPHRPCADVVSTLHDCSWSQP